MDFKSLDKMDLFLGKLSADSSNVVQLVKAQYEAITSSIEMKDNATGSVKVKITNFIFYQSWLYKRYFYFLFYFILFLIKCVGEISV
jgi:hypothetical protein